MDDERQDEPDVEPEVDPTTARHGIVFLGIVIEGGMILLAILVGWLLEQPPLARMRWEWSALFWGIAATGPAILLLLVLTRWPIGPLRSMRQFVEEVLVPLFRPCSLVDLLGISCLAGLGEEMLFRGVLQDALSNPLSPWLAVVLAGVVFGALHAITLTYALFAAGMGIYLGALYLWTDNLLAPIVTHALYDFLALLYLVRWRTDCSAED